MGEGGGKGRGGEGASLVALVVLEALDENVAGGEERGEEQAGDEDGRVARVGRRVLRRKEHGPHQAPLQSCCDVRPHSEGDRSVGQRALRRKGRGPHQAPLQPPTAPCQPGVQPPPLPRCSRIAAVLQPRPRAGTPVCSPRRCCVAAPPLPRCSRVAAPTARRRLVGLTVMVRCGPWPRPVRRAARVAPDERERERERKRDPL